MNVSVCSFFLLRIRLELTVFLISTDFIFFIGNPSHIAYTVYNGQRAKHDFFYVQVLLQADVQTIFCVLRRETVRNCQRTVSDTKCASSR